MTLLKTVKSPKDAFFPQSENLYTCEKEGKNITIEPQALQEKNFVVFGMKACDVQGVKVLDNISFTLGHDDKVAFVGANEQAITTLFKILVGEMEPDEGNYKWGVTTSQAYFPKDNTAEFDNDLTITDWLTQYSEIKDATYVRDSSDVCSSPVKTASNVYAFFPVVRKSAVCYQS